MEITNMRRSVATSGTAPMIENGTRPRWRLPFGPRGLIVIAVLAVVAGGIFNWSWLVAAGIAPIILAMAPCGIMCALGLCMMPKRREPSAPQDAGDKAALLQASLPEGPQAQTERLTGRLVDDVGSYHVAATQTPVSDQQPVAASQAPAKGKRGCC